MLEGQGSPLQSRPALKHQHSPTKLHQTLGRSVSAAQTHTKSPGSASLGCLWPPLRSSSLGKVGGGQRPADICQRCSGVSALRRARQECLESIRPAPRFSTAKNLRLALVDGGGHLKESGLLITTVWRQGECKVTSVLSRLFATL